MKFDIHVEDNCTSVIIYFLNASAMQDHKDKDIILGGLFTVHYDGVNASYDGGCGQVI